MALRRRVAIRRSLLPCLGALPYPLPRHPVCHHRGSPRSRHRRNRLPQRATKSPQLKKHRQLNLPARLRNPRQPPVPTSQRRPKRRSLRPLRRRSLCRRPRRFSPRCARVAVAVCRRPRRRKAELPVYVVFVSECNARRSWHPSSVCYPTNVVLHTLNRTRSTGTKGAAINYVTQKSQIFDPSPLRGAPPRPCVAPLITLSNVYHGP